MNELTPPLPYDDSSFDLVYAFSVMTHLSEELQRAWVQECRRVLKPGGYFVFSTLGEYFVSRDRLTDDERRSFERGKLVVLYERSAGTSLCSAYHPPEYVRRELADGFDVVAFRPAADDGRHDIHVLRKRPSALERVVDSKSSPTGGSGPSCCSCWRSPSTRCARSAGRSSAGATSTSTSTATSSSSTGIRCCRGRCCFARRCRASSTAPRSTWPAGSSPSR